MEYKGISYNLKGKFENLKILTLANNKISKHELYFLSITNFPLLKILDLQSNDICDEGILYLWQEKLKLVYLNLNNNKIGNQGLEYLSNKNFPYLKYLYLMNNRITCDGCFGITPEKFPEIKYLDLDKNFIGYEGLLYLSENIKENFPNLKSLSCSNLN
jgi:Ran GTPase-activating protein (RanGAP) involved in mRNA processing and transport